MADFLFANNVSTTLNGAVGTGDTTWTVADGSIFPTPVAGKTLRATAIKAADSTVEIVDITAISTNDLTVTRAREGTTALAFADGDTVELRVTKEMLENFPQLGRNNTFGKGQRSAVPTLAALSDVFTPDMNASNWFEMTVDGSDTLANPTNLTAGQSGVIYITKTNAGDSLAYGTYWPADLDDFADMSTSETGAIYYSVISSTSIDASTKFPVGV